LQGAECLNVDLSGIYTMTYHVILGVLTGVSEESTAFIYPKDGICRFLRTISWYLQCYMVYKPRRPTSKYNIHTQL